MKKTLEKVWIYTAADGSRHLDKKSCADIDQAERNKSLYRDMDLLFRRLRKKGFFHYWPSSILHMRRSGTINVNSTNGYWCKKRFCFYLTERHLTNNDLSRRDSFRIHKNGNKFIFTIRPHETDLPVVYVCSVPYNWIHLDDLELEWAVIDFLAKKGWLFPES